MASIKVQGTILEIGNGVISTTPTYTTAAQVKEIDFGALAHMMADVTHLSSTGGWFEQTPTGRKEEVEITLTIIRDTAAPTHANSSGGLYHAWENETPLAYKITYPNSANLEMDALIKSIQDIVGNGEDVLLWEVILGVTGPITLALS